MEIVTLERGANCAQCGRYFPPGSEVRRYGKQKTVYCIGDHQPQGQAAPRVPAPVNSSDKVDKIYVLIESVRTVLQGIEELVRKYIESLER